MTKIKCHFCGDTYPDQVKRIIDEGGIQMCPHCYDLLIKEHLTAKEYQKRLKQK